ncbi:MAG: hypothetical protein V9E81_06235 [Marmoricola sp.]
MFSQKTFARGLISLVLSAGLIVGIGGSASAAKDTGWGAVQTKVDTGWG